jgi:hypothetical protein
MCVALTIAEDDFSMSAFRHAAHGSDYCVEMNAVSQA